MGAGVSSIATVWHQCSDDGILHMFILHCPPLPRSGAEVLALALTSLPTMWNGGGAPALAGYGSGCCGAGAASGTSRALQHLAHHLKASAIAPEVQGCGPTMSV